MGLMSPSKDLRKAGREDGAKRQRRWCSLAVLSIEVGLEAGEPEVSTKDTA